MGICLAGLVLHLVVSEEILSRTLLSASEAGAFMLGIDRALYAGAIVAAIGALTSLIKRSAIAGKA